MPAVLDAPAKSLWSYNPIPTGCVLYLPLWSPGLGGLAGSRFKSIDPYGHLCTVTGALRIPNGRIFDGTDDWVEIGDASTFKFLHGALDTTGFKWTISFWMRMPVPEPNALYSLVSTGKVSSTGVGADIFFDDRVGSGMSRNLRLQLNNGAATFLNHITANNAYPNDIDWHHICYTYDQALANTNSEIFVDASSKGTANKGVQTPSTSNSEGALHIGSNAIEASEFIGDIGEVLIYSRVLSAVEITYLYQRTKGRYL